MSRTRTAGNDGVVATGAAAAGKQMREIAVTNASSDRVIDLRYCVRVTLARRAVLLALSQMAVADGKVWRAPLKPRQLRRLLAQDPLDLGVQGGVLAGALFQASDHFARRQRCERPAGTR